MIRDGHSGGGAPSRARNVSFLTIDSRDFPNKPQAGGAVHVYKPRPSIM